MDSTKAVIADDPAHRLMIRPTETTSAWPLFRMVSTVLPIRLSATSSLKMVCRKTVVCLRTSFMVPGPNSSATYPVRPSSASSRGAVDSADQKAACELIPKRESPQALLMVRTTTFRQRRRTRPFAVGTGPLPSMCHGSVSSAGDGSGASAAATGSAAVSVDAVGAAGSAAVSVDAVGTAGPVEVGSVISDGLLRTSAFCTTISLAIRGPPMAQSLNRRVGTHFGQAATRSTANRTNGAPRHRQPLRAARQVRTGGT